MAKYIKNVELRHGILSVEFALIFSLVIVIGHFFLPGNGMMKHLDGIIDVVLGRVTADTGDYKPSGMWEPSEPTPEEPPTNTDPTADGVVVEALREAFSGVHSKDNTIMYNIIAVKIVSDGNGKRKITIQTNVNGGFQNLESYFSGNGSDIISGIINGVPGGDTVKDGIYNVKIE